MIAVAHSALNLQPRRADHSHVTVRPLKLILARALVLAGLQWVINSNQMSGAVVMSLSRTHGIHKNDWLTLVLWAAAIVVVMPPRTIARLIPRRA